MKFIISSQRSTEQKPCETHNLSQFCNTRVWCSYHNHTSATTCHYIPGFYASTKLYC